MTAQPIEIPGTDIARAEPAPNQALTLRASMDYAQALAQSNMLPTQYRKNPANVLWAMEYGRTIGLSPMAAITGVHVIEGKPSASAGLISGLVRRAGHKLRIKGDAQSATATIIRSDDPDEPFVVTFTMEDAKRAGLLSKKVWQQYGPSMLKARAITQCARDACEEVLFGLHYTAEELGAETDEEGQVVTVATVHPIMGDPEPAAPEMDRAAVVRAIAAMAGDCGDAEKLRATFREASQRGLLDEDVWDSVGELAAAISVGDGELTLRQWLAACGTHVETTGEPVAVTVNGPADTVDAETVTVDGEEPDGWAREDTEPTS